MTSLLKNMNYRSHTGLGAKHPIIEEFNLSEVAVSDDEWESLWEEWSMVGELKNKLLEDVGNIIDEALNAVDEGDVVVEFTNENVNSVKNVVRQCFVKLPRLSKFLWVGLIVEKVHVGRRRFGRGSRRAVWVRRTRSLTSKRFTGSWKWKVIDARS